MNTTLRNVKILVAIYLAILVGAICAKASDLPMLQWKASSDRPDLQLYQTTPVPPSQTFVSSVLNYFSSFNTNLPVGTPTLSFWAGADTVDNQTMTASMGVELTPFATSANAFLAGLSVESVTRNTTVAGVVFSEQAGVGWSMTHIDTRLTGFLDVGNRFDTKQVYFSPGLGVKKMLTPNTFAGTRIELPIYLNHGAGVSSGAPSPTISVNAGFNY